MGSMAFFSTFTKSRRSTTATAIMAREIALTHSNLVPPNSMNSRISARKTVRRAIPLVSMCLTPSSMGVGNFLMVRMKAAMARGTLM